MCLHFSTKPQWNPPLLQGGASKTNLGKDTTPHTHPSETPHIVERTPNNVRDTHTLHAHRKEFTHIHNVFKTIWLAITHFHILTRMSGHANPQTVHVLVFNSSYYINFNHYQASHGPGTTADAIHKPNGPPGKYINCQVSNISLLRQFTCEQGMKWINFFLPK